MTSYPQALLFELEPVAADREATSTTFLDNMKLPVHRWMRYSAGYSAAWAESVIRGAGARNVLDPFVGSGTTLLAAQDAGAKGYGIEAHPFVVRIARGKLHRVSDAAAFENFAAAVRKEALGIVGQTEGYPALIEKCYEPSVLRQLDALRRAVEKANDGTLQAELTWLVLASLLRKVSHANTAQWQYVLPSKSKAKVVPPMRAFDETVRMFAHDIRTTQYRQLGPVPLLIQGDARTCCGVPDGEIDLVVTSPPYPNNYDYADSTRLEMSFFQEITGWGDLQDAVRQHLVRSCSQHVPEKKVSLPAVLADPVLAPILDELASVCTQLSDIRHTKGGKKTYYLMVACYFQDLAHVWHSLRRVCGSPSRLCFVIGDSAPYGVYVPVIQWFEKLALSAGFGRVSFEQTRERNIKWKNRKHRVPLCEGRLWVEG
jgi:hypothetical protein